MYKLKTFAQRSMMLGAAAMLVTASLPPVQVFAYNELNPLTKRSLLLSSSAPGYVDTDGSGNSTDSPNPTGSAYAPAGSGANGKKTGQTFTFNVSTDSVNASKPVKGLSFQYCTTAAGNCFAPGTNQGDFRDSVGDGRQLNTQTKGAYAPAHSEERSDFDVVGSLPFEIYHEGTLVADSAGTTDWAVSATNSEDALAGTDPEQATTGTKNYITLTSPTGISPAFDDELKIVFKANEQNYITNPGGGKFFVKINTYSDNVNLTTEGEEATRIDGGVTVANMMTDSIHITTKVLETMQFSVGTTLPEQEESPTGGYGVCDAISVVNNNRIDLGNPNAENSLETDRAHEQKSYWRVQSNSSGGATIYYSGDTLRNTVGDHIEPIAPAGSQSIPGREQFGLALVSAENDVHANFLAAIDPQANALQQPTLDPLSGMGTYSTGAGAYDSAGNGSARSDSDESGNWLKEDGTIADNEEETDFATFAFNVNSRMVPEPIAQGTEVLSCTTGKMRYVGNIGADTPAGVYTTKINYLAAPKY